MHEFYERIYDKKDPDQGLITDNSRTFANPITDNSVSVYFEGIKGMWYFTIGPADDAGINGYIDGLVKKNQTASRSYWYCELILEDKMNHELTRVSGSGNAVPNDLKEEINNQTRLGAIIGSLFFLNEQPETEKVVVKNENKVS